MDIYRGTIVEESLTNKGMIGKLKVTASSVSSNSHWHLYTVEVSEKDIADISRNLNAARWYAHFWKGRKVIVAFKDKILKFDYGKKETLKPVVDYGLSMGIPKEQLDFPIDKS